MKNDELVNWIKNRYQAMDHVRRGICLLNAGAFAAAEKEFQKAGEFGASNRSLPSYLAACCLGRGRADQAAERFARIVDDDATDTVARIRQAMALWSAGKSDAAVTTLRQAVRRNPESAELHFQLGTFLTSLDRFEEAELRFTQAISIDGDHTEATVSLALCCGVRNAPGEALAPLRRAHAKRPHDARVGLLMAQAAKATEQQGGVVRVHATMPEEDPLSDARGIEELSDVIADEPDFVDAFLSIPVGSVDEGVFAMLLATLETALERQPEHAELHYHCGRVLARLGRSEDAITENEKAVQLDPTFTRALIELGKLYHRTDRTADATTRLEQALAAGAEFADVYLLLGHLYRDQGHPVRARTAYQRALAINERYAEAIDAQSALPA